MRLVADVITGAGTCGASQASSSGRTLSALFKTVTIGLSTADNSLSTSKTLTICSSTLGWLESTTCINTSAILTSSSVARNAATREVGNFLMKPTVSEMSTVRPLGKIVFLVVGSSVANNLSSTKTSDLVRAFNN